MAIRIPSNQIIFKYTTGNEYMFEKNYRNYQGYYYEINGSLFAGDKFDPNAALLVPIPKGNIGSSINPLLIKAATYVYGKVSNIAINNTKLTSHIFQYNSNIRYFSYNIKTKIIKEVNKDTFDIFKNDPLYIVISLSYNGGFNDIELNDAEIKIPGIKTFINNSYIPPSVEENGEIG